MKNHFIVDEKSLFRAIWVEIIALTILIFLSILLLWMQHLGQRKLHNADRLRYESRLLADQLRHSSDDLTRMIRTYVATGDGKFEQYFWDILAIRDGEKPRPVHYERIYWDFMTVKHPTPPFENGEKASLKALMRRDGFTEKEFQLLAVSKERSDRLVSMEKIAIDAMKGRFQDDKGGFSIKGKPDPEMARRIVFGEKYHEAKKSIMEPLNEFFEAIDQRTSQNVTQADSQVKLYQRALVGLFGAVIFNSVLLLLTAGRHQRLQVLRLKHAVGRKSHELNQSRQAESLRAAQLRLIEFASDHSGMQVMQKFLDEAEVLTGSTVGFFHFVGGDQITLRLQTWSTNTLKNMCKAQGSGLHYPVSKAGVWVDCIHKRKPVIHNDYVSLPHKKGLPEGHAPIFRELVVPVFREEKIVAIFGVGNKADIYDEKDVGTIQQLADLAWETVSRKQAEQDLQEYRRNLEKTVNQRTEELEKEIEQRKRIEAELRLNMADLERFNAFAVDREEQMIRLKKEVNGYLRQMGREEKYAVIE